MRREDLEHIIPAAAEIADDDEIVVIGRKQTLLARLENTEIDEQRRVRTAARVRQAFPDQESGITPPGVPQPDRSATRATRGRPTRPERR